MQFLHKIVTELLSKYHDLSVLKIVLPGKRPVVFIKEILKEKNYNGILPEFFTIEDLIIKIADRQPIQGIALWLFAYDIYHQQYPGEDFSSFLKWFPTLLKDWDDMLKFSGSDTGVLEFMLDEERIKNWGETLGNEDNARTRNLNFWRKMNIFLPVLKVKLKEKKWATLGMIHESAKEKLDQENWASLLSNEKYQWIFCGFNAFTPIEENLVKKLLQWDRAECFFQADEYYIEDLRQEAGKFLRNYRTWKEFNENRAFNWVENEFSQPKSIKVYEVSGNVTQAKVLPEIFGSMEDKNLSNVAVVLLDENLLPATLDAMNSVENINITMGFPLKNLSFSNAMKKLFYLHKQLDKNASSYYYADVLPILEELPSSDTDREIIKNFIEKIEQRNIVYLSKNLLKELLSELTYFQLFTKQSSVELLDCLINFCTQLKFEKIDDIQYENISHFEKSFKILKNQIKPYSFEVSVETLEVLINQLVNLETIDFQGEPLSGLQVMGLLETRLLNFDNVIMLSVNEGKLPLGNSQNTYLPFDVRKNFGLNTFLENDGIYAYHFYRLIQGAKHIHLLFNALSSGVNTGEKSRFITQMEMESPHTIEHIIIENSSEPIIQTPISIPKTPKVMERLCDWKESVSASHLTTYLYNPVDFYLNNVLKTRETEEIEEELSQRNYGNLVHYALQNLYEDVKGKPLSVDDLQNLKHRVDEALLVAVEKLNHDPEFYESGMNFVHKSIAKRVVEHMLDSDVELIKEGNSLEIIELEKKVNAEFYLDEGKKDRIVFNGYIDRIDKLNGTLRIIDYKTAKPKNLSVKPKEEKLDSFLSNNDYKQALQLSIYAYAVMYSGDMENQELQCGIWSFAEAGKGVQTLKIYDEYMLNKSNIQVCMNAIRTIILEILNPEIPFVEENKVTEEVFTKGELN
ncbi:MAG: PD-(D/E)XK nuclease family protein [Cloacibacterium sp.]|nr:PD-(D/E)XK nuclease family protein [Cloacibacterium sp.]